MPVCSAKMAADGKPARDRTGILEYFIILT
jgi:hypothetical protein